MSRKLAVKLKRSGNKIMKKEVTFLFQNHPQRYT